MFQFQELEKKSKKLNDKFELMQCDALISLLINLCVWLLTIKMLLKSEKRKRKLKKKIPQVFNERKKWQILPNPVWINPSFCQKGGLEI